MSETFAHRFFDKLDLGKVPAGWKVDRDGWLWRPTQSTDAVRIAKKRSPHRMFTGNGSDCKAEHGKTFCCEPYEAEYLDAPGAKP